MLQRLNSAFLWLLCAAVSTGCSGSVPSKSDDLKTKKSVGETGFQFPTEPGSAAGAELIEKDLLVLQADELAQAQKEVSKGRKPSEVAREVSARLMKENLRLLAQLKVLKAPTPSSHLVSAITQVQAQGLLDQMLRHPVVGDEATQRYDSNGDQAGFCFGRAAYLHAELLRRGVHPKSIGKIFAVGGLIQPGGGVWDFHVATVVRKSGGGWLAIDGLSPKPLELEAWTESILKMALFPSRPTLRFYFADAVKFLPIPGGYTAEKMDVPIYQGYFRDLRSWLTLHPLQTFETYLGK